MKFLTLVVCKKTGNNNDYDQKDQKEKTEAAHWFLICILS